MSITLGSNIASLRGQRQLTKTSDELSTVFQRLSSGQRINKASDDAAGLAIADSLNASSRVFNQGVRNLNDGLSLLNIADKAIENLSTIVIRLEELAEQSANGVYSNQQRKALDGEAQALADEFFRISKTTEFNGQKLFIGENPVVSLQAGIGQDAIINASVGGAIGTGGFGSASTFSVGNQPFSVTTGDFNGDGITDLVTANNGADTSVLLGNGSGGFSTASTFSVGGNPQSVTTGDFNGDGILDLVTADQTANTTSVLLGNGLGGFGPASTFSVGASPQSVTTGDFNGDGITDLVTADFAGDTSVLLGNGVGGFGPASTFSVGAGPNSVTTGDFNGDGNLDLVTADSSSFTTSVLLGDGSGGFGAATTYSVGANPYSVTTGDFNGDGNLDLVTADFSDGTTSVLLGNGSGGFGAAATYSVGANPISVATADFNGDGMTDLVTADYGADTTSVLLGNGTGGFGTATTYSLGATPESISTGDFNGDGVTDLVIADAGISVLLGKSIDGVAPLLDFSLLTMADARQALPVFGRKREQLAAQRGQIGANQAKIEVAANVLTVASENFKAAESRIRDADIAQEAANLTRLNILQQAASSILAQANQQPALALTLLR